MGAAVTERLVRIGGASGAWGDSPMAIGQLLTTDVDYLMMDYLAEVTMSLLARARMKDANAGFPPDFVAYLKPHLPELARRKIKVVSNAGAVNPQACKRAIESACADAGVSMKVAVVEGDDVMPLLDALRAEGIREAVSGAPIPARMLTANAYLGALPIAAALAQGADIVVTGRCADSALPLGVLMHEFGWTPKDYDLLAAGSLVGHLLECGPQSTGGTFTDWDQVPDWHNIGYPIAECRQDGTFTLAKPKHTGGLISPLSVGEQVLYEIGDPAAYILPDLVADFSHVRIEQEGPDRVHVSGARGYPPTDTYKVSATWQDGYRATASVSIVGPDAVRKAERTASGLIDRSRMLFARRGIADFAATHVEALGSEASYVNGARSRSTREVLLRLVVDHRDREGIDVFARELGSIGLSFAPGTTGIYGGRPKAVPIVRLFTFYIPKKRLPLPRVQIGDVAPFEIEIPSDGGYRSTAHETSAAIALESGQALDIELRKLAVARSGDKGNSSNIAILARRPEFTDVLRHVLTSERMADHFRGIVTGPVTRFEAPGLNAFNFLLEEALGGGGMASHRIDPQGKSYGQRALEMRIPVPQWVHDMAAAARTDTGAAR
jgi:hypothetical protein